LDSRPLVEFDHHSAGFATDPDTFLRELRERCPVAWSESHGGFWALTRFADVDRVLTDPATFSSRHELDPGSPFLGVTIPPPPMAFVPVEMDPPESVAYRRILNPLFSPAAVDRLRPRIEHFTDFCLEQFAARGQLDFVHDLTSPLPAMVTLDIMGLPVDDWQRYATTFHDMVAYPPGSAELEGAFASAQAINAELHELVDARRADPDRVRLGGVDALVDAEIDGEPLPVDRLVDIIRLILAGGIDTTTGAATGAFVYLGQHPEAMQRLIDEPALLGGACEEFVRWITPTPLLARTTTCPVDIDGLTIPEHERVMANLAAANRDPATFADPDAVVLDRAPNRHVAFGAGIHRCVGANLARAEMEIMIAAVLRRMPDYEIVPDGVSRYRTSGVQNGFVAAHATFPPFASI
jgi:cytochrome P450